MSELEIENQTLKQEITLLKFELAQLKKMLFGASRERFIPQTSPDQGSLFGDAPVATQTVPEPEVELVKRKKKKKRIFAPRVTFPASLRRVEEVIIPEDFDPQKHIKIGEDRTELIAYTPADLFVRCLIRYRFAEKNNSEQGIVQAPIPPRLIPKGMVDESLIADLITEKIMYHTPLHRYRKKLVQAGVSCISEQNLANWFASGAEGLIPLYHLFKDELLALSYLQGDETYFPVLCKNKPGATHRGYLWVLHSPEQKAVLFQYDPARSKGAAENLLMNYTGILQTDGYQPYESLQKTIGYELVHCMAHGRRKFMEALESDPQRATYFLERVGKLYAIEEQARKRKLDHEDRLALRQKESIPLLDELGEWLKKEYLSGKLLPSSPIANAVTYNLQRWKRLSAYAKDGQLEIDNNLIENRIRPVALGRKNYLFAGSHDAAQNLACLYSIVGTAEKHGLNVQQYLTWLLQKVASNKVTSEALNWLPHHLDKELLTKFKL